MITSTTLPLLSAAESRELADILASDPINTIPVQALRRGKARAFVKGRPSHFDAAVVEVDYLPEEPSAFGTNVDALGALLQDVAGWACVFLDGDRASPLARLYVQAGWSATRIYGATTFLLNLPCEHFEHPMVRLLDVDDLDAFRANPEARPRCWTDTRECLERRLVAGAIADNQVVSFAQIDAMTESHAEVFVHTKAAWRNRGLGRACASAVVTEAQRLGRAVLWDAGHDNWGSLAIARHLGFVKYRDRAYVIPSFAAGRREPDQRRPIA